MSESGAAADSHLGVQFHEHLNLWVWRPRGILDEAMIDDIIECIKAKEGKVGKPRLELHGALLSAAERNPRWNLEVPGGAAAMNASSALPNEN